MKYYSDLAEMRVFTLDEAINIIGNKDNAINYLSRMCKNGLINRIKKNLYSVIDLSTKTDIANHYFIASHINECAFISYHTAFEFYGFYNQSYSEVQVSSPKRFTDFIYNDLNYHYILSNITKQIDIVQGVKVTSLERTIVDSINMLGKVMDVEELVKCLDFINYVDVNKLMEMLLEYDKDILYRKVGYVLSYFKESLNLDNSFFDFCKKHSNVLNYGYLSYGEIKQLEFISEWGLYAYKDLKSIIGKGGDIDV